MGDLLKFVGTEVTGRSLDLLHQDELQVNQYLKLFWEDRREEVGRDRRSKVIQLPPQTNLIEVFERDDVSRRLLILGEPGAGKTTSLLKLAADLITQAQQNQTAPIPVIFELSTWKNDSESIKQWLVKQLKENHSIDFKISRKCLEQNRILPLLDGLDELGLVRQKIAIQRINQYLQQDLARQIVVCCRWEEYKQGKVQLYRLRGAYYLQPPSETDIRNYLEQLNQQDLWQKIATNNQMKKLAQKPLFLNLMMKAFQGEAIVSESQLFTEYIEEQLQRPLNPQKYPQGKPPYSDDDTKKWLTYLAGQLEADSLTVFLIEKMQPYWLNPGRERRLFRLISGLISGLVLSLISVPISGLMSVSISGLISGLILGLILGLISGLILGLSSWGFKEDKLKTEAFKLTWQGVRKGLISGLILGPILGLSYVLSYGLGYGLSHGLTSELISGLISVLIYGLIYGLSFGVINNLNVEINYREKPNQGINESWKKILIIYLLTSPFGMLIFPLTGLFIDSSFTGIESVGFGLLLGSLIILFTVGKNLIQHLTLRLILGQQGLIPRNYDHFLDYADERKLIERIGGQYRFLHDSLRKHFAAQAPRPKRII
ncbi:MAG: NACHT domain-containing protein [Waterburya sp.]